MNLIKIAMAKELFRAGAFTHAHIAPSPMEDGYIAILMKGEDGRILSNDKGSPRLFKTLETARTVLKDIGFPTLTVS